MGKGKGKKGDNAHSPKKSDSPAKKRHHSGKTSHVTEFHSASTHGQFGLVPRPDNPNNLAAPTANPKLLLHATPMVPSMESFPQLTTAIAIAHNTSQHASLISPLSDTASPTAHDSVGSNALGMMDVGNGTDGGLNQTGALHNTDDGKNDNSDNINDNSATSSAASAEAAEAAATTAAAAAAAATAATATDAWATIASATIHITV